MSKTNSHRERLKTAFNNANLSRIHHSPIFWVGVLLFGIAMAIYVLSDNFVLTFFAH